MHPAEILVPGQATTFDGLSQELKERISNLLIPYSVTIRSHHYSTDARGTAASINGIELLDEDDERFDR